MAENSINLNTAGIDELQEIEGIGPERAEAILRYREEHGPFNSWEDFDKVPGLSERMIEVVKRSGAIIK